MTDTERGLLKNSKARKANDVSGNIEDRTGSKKSNDEAVVFAMPGKGEGN